MSLFRCTTCGCVENTALGCFWTHDDKEIWKPEDLKGPRCSECGPTHFKDGTPTGYGEWHAKFSKQSAVGYHVDGSGYLWGPGEDKPFPIVGVIGPDGAVVPLEKKPVSAAWPFPT